MSLSGFFMVLCGYQQTCVSVSVVAVALSRTDEVVGTGGTNGTNVGSGWGEGWLSPVWETGCSISGTGSGYLERLGSISLP